MFSILNWHKDNERKIHFYSKKGVNSYSYSSLIQSIHYLETDFKNRGIKKGDVVALMFPTSLELVATFFALWKIGATPTFLYPPIRLGKIDFWLEKTKHCLKEVDARFLILHDILKMTGNSLPIEHFSVSLKEIDSFESYPSSFSLKEIEINDKEIAFIQFSSGSTGSPRPIEIPFSALYANIKAIIKALNIKEGTSESCVSWLPLYHDMGLVGGFLCAIYAKASLTLIEPSQFLACPSLWFKAISKMKATVSVAPNFSLGLLSKRFKESDYEGVDLSSLRVLMCGAEHISNETYSKFYRFFSPYGLSELAFTPVYGLAENTLAATFSKASSVAKAKYFDEAALKVDKIAIATDHGRELFSVGFPVEGTQIEILDDCGESLGEAHVGEVAFFGSSMCANVKRDSFGRIRTGDFGLLYEGELFILGRKKEVLIINGRNIDPVEIEQVASKIPGVREGTVMAFSSTKNQKDSEEIIVFLEQAHSMSDKGLSNLKNEIKKDVLKEVALTVSEIHVFKKSSLPRTSSGKLMRVKAKELYESGKYLSLEGGPVVDFFSKYIALFKLFVFYPLKKKMAYDKRS
ncbi:AMP-binding protein [Halobacteriovorax sp. GB3]|uniref:AMP-binding protein n=1 Tax=Halobacteriovorax sp. GB3 TaxID=2719615 RepID=UPI00235E5C90|nr:AMP-binding protein [Halobacteriovorax sp. GB3]MDD0852927.1 AMP-binding protein [Halobacteriovorax sp. GB3]